MLLNGGPFHKRTTSLNLNYFILFQQFSVVIGHCLCVCVCVLVCVRVYVWVQACFLCVCYSFGHLEIFIYKWLWHFIINNRCCGLPGSPLWRTLRNGQVQTGEALLWRNSNEGNMQRWVTALRADKSKYTGFLLKPQIVFQIMWDESGKNKMFSRRKKWETNRRKVIGPNLSFQFIDFWFISK